MGLEPTTFRTLVERSNHWATENSNGEQWSFVGDIWKLKFLNTQTVCVLFTPWKYEKPQITEWFLWYFNT